MEFGDKQQNGQQSGNNITKQGNVFASSCSDWWWVGSGNSGGQHWDHGPSHFKEMLWSWETEMCFQLLQPNPN